ncbi:MAG: hypothetical protein M1816_004544 [Peltula sp. TS41687]|nr:MAG: hypothetical protein M1816_004544 [Peltula sp. TS41687]
MAANYWVSSQRRHWQFSRDELRDIRSRLEDSVSTSASASAASLITQYPLPERRLLSVFFREQITKLGRRLQLRQQAQATAQIYVRRFYTRVEIRRTNPYLVLAVALYLAAKMEECPQHIRLVVNEARNAWPEFITTDSAKIGEGEFRLIHELNSQLIVHHPYRTLSEVQTVLGLSTEENSTACAVVNDHYLTDLPLLYPPHVIAVTAIFFTLALKPSSASSTSSSASASASAQQSSAAALQQQQQSSGGCGGGGTAQQQQQQNKLQRFLTWLAESNVDMEAVVDCMQEMISLYEVWEQYNERVCKEQIARFVKARGLDK